MIGIKSLQLVNVRSHNNASFEFVDSMNAVVGPNGSGKTTIIEALYTLLRGSSFKGAVNEIAQYGSNQFRAEINVESKNTTHTRSLGYQKVDESIQKKWSVDGKTTLRLPVAARLPVVLFEPDLARLISGGPERRRNYLDQIAAQLDIEVAYAQNRFDRALKQRNQLLKRLRESKFSSSTEELFVWNTQLASLGTTIVSARASVIENIQKEISTYYAQLGGIDPIFLTYQSNVSLDPRTYGTTLLQFLEANVTRDVTLGYTSFGPHRDDLEIRVADQPAVQRASRGEVRTLVIALKLLETELLSKHYAQSEMKPTLLLDDVLSELDLVHQERVLAGFKDHQVFITTTDAHALTPGVHTIALG